MAQPKYHTLFDLISMIDEPNKMALWNLIGASRNAMLHAHGSVHNHQSWEGGWWDHMTEVMNIAVVLYPTLHALRPLPFTLSDALLVLFLHDIEKPWKYEEKDGIRVHRAGMETKAKHQHFRMQVGKAWGIALTDEHVNAIKYAEGELDDYNSRERIAGPLAAFAHLCDHWSARGWFDCPREANDPWKGAHRVMDDSGVDNTGHFTRFKANMRTTKRGLQEAQKHIGDCGCGCGCKKK